MLQFLPRRGKGCRILKQGDCRACQCLVGNDHAFHANRSATASASLPAVCRRARHLPAHISHVGGSLAMTHTSRLYFGSGAESDIDVAEGGAQRVGEGSLRR